MAPPPRADIEFSDPTRIALIAELEQLIRVYVKPEAWAFVWLADVDRLESIVYSLKYGTQTEKQLVCDVMHEHFTSDIIWTETVKPWMFPDEATSVANTSPSLNPTPVRNKAAKREAFERDDQRCVLTKGGKCVEMSYIFAYSLNKHLSDKAIMWFTLQNTFSEERITRWKKALFTERGTEICQNYLTLNPTAQACWNGQEFALKPLDGNDEDGKQMQVQLFWLKHRDEWPEFIRLSEVPDLPSNLDSGRKSIKLFDCEDETKIRSGDIITLTTDNPDERPLPSKDILELQWFLHRVCALSGASKAYDKEEDEGEDDDDDGIDVISI